MNKKKHSSCDLTPTCNKEPTLKKREKTEHTTCDRKIHVKSSQHASVVNELPRFIHFQLCFSECCSSVFFLDRMLTIMRSHKIKGTSLK